ADKGDYRRALGCLSQAALLNPRSWITLTALAGVYVHLESLEMASHILERALALKPNESTILTTLGEIYSEEREYEKACDAYAAALQAEPGMHEAGIGLARANASLGRDAEAAAVFERLWDGGLHTLDIMTGLVGLPPVVVRKNLLTELGRVIPEPTDSKADFDTEVAFIRASALDRAGRHGEAWQDAMTANRAMAAKVEKSLAAESAHRQAKLATSRTDTLRIASPRQDETQPLSLFILGPSRSGKTTLEALVGTLDGVRRGYENPSLENAISRTYQEAGLINTYSLDHMPPQFYPQLREFYAEELARRAASAKVFTNTHPGYIEEVAQIAAILPNTRFIFVKRNVDDNALRIFMRRYRKGNPHSYELKAARQYIEWYHAMIDALAARLPDIARVVSYEEMVADPAGAVQIAATLCGLPKPEQPLPAIGDDRNCAAPYRDRFSAAHA
ncbi:MAG: sulfotransferase, partial [Rhodospirillales bacterium]